MTGTTRAFRGVHRARGRSARVLCEEARRGVHGKQPDPGVARRGGDGHGRPGNDLRPEAVIATATTLEIIDRDQEAGG
jgi:hypothetical protein